MKYLDSKNIDFFIRSVENDSTLSDMKDLMMDKEWTVVKTNRDQQEIMEMPHKNTSYRIIMSRQIINDPKNPYLYKGIITNNKDMSPSEIFYFYNQRGKSEHNFCELLNDFNWKRLPFSFLEENTVFMCIAAITKILYHYLIQEFSKTHPFIQNTFRLKKFITYFIIVPSVWERVKDKWKLLLYTDKEYGSIYI